MKRVERTLGVASRSGRCQAWRLIEASLPQGHCRCVGLVSLGDEAPRGGGVPRHRTSRREVLTHQAG